MVQFIDDHRDVFGVEPMGVSEILCVSYCR